MQSPIESALDSPELLLQSLNAALRELRGAVDLLDDSELSDQLAPAMRSLLLAEVLGSESIIAIGGAQGAGKTTLLGAIYQLEGPDAEWLKPNRGQGERMPVLVIEEPGRTTVEGSVRSMQKGPGDRYQVMDLPVSVGVFHRVTRDPAPSELLPVLRVPQRFFQRANQAWLLLPGYEKEERENRDWQRLMRQALVAASGCVIVTDQTRLANQLARDIVQDMMSNELRGAQTLVVISKTESLRDNLSAQQTLRSTAQEVFKTDDQWILCTGTDDPSYVAEWLPVFEAAARDLALSGGCGRVEQLARLQEVLRHELMPAVTRVNVKAQSYLSSREGGQNGPREVVDACLSTFDDESSLLREDYRRKVGAALDQILSQSRGELNSRLVEDHEGIWNHLKDYFRTASESNSRITTDITEAWKCGGSVLEAHSAAIGQLTTAKLGAPAAVISAQSAHALPGKAAMAERLGYAKGTAVEAWSRPNAKDMHNLRALFGSHSSEVSTITDFNKDVERSIKLLPALVLEYARVASLAPGIVGVDVDKQSPVAALQRPDLVGQALGQLGEGVNLGQTVLRGIAAVLALDVGVDGELDVVNVLTTVFTGEAGADAAASMVTGFGAAVIGVVAVGYLIHSALQQVRLHDLKASLAADTMLRSIRDHHLVHFLQHYDDMMAKIRAHLLQSLRRRYRLDELLVGQDRLARALADVRSLQSDLLHQLERTGQSLTLLHPTSRNG
ncbi:MAG: hypothetical protein KBC73_22605 [Burkholderiaceae bacterium]|nr:hypothetical protein [Burkholderiaceae bacterium]